ncbi:homoserine O-acetyltransferase [Catalinimonas alkaloidigena]|uniref:homoserine O-acetyltransferase MetX n=1 Tax=Catalinimonas alkaloidigena TaxID=1075417 RepID=UPI0024071A7F|nr:homoserine O-acetyltransferase [Catalinimonas alkaloidigena]MDF9798116.1 homoserine O-acetyltransferase [Catalinimonas alkaloidigena]
MQREDNFIYEEQFMLESGESLPGFQLRYTTFGQLNEAKDNVIWVCHALTANANFLDWWEGLFGKGRLYDPEKYFIICANMLGSCYGSTGPLSINPASRKPYFHDFPLLSNRDMVKAFDLLRQSLGIDRIHTVIGGSLGGQHALEWAVMEPDRITHMVQLCSNAQHSPWGIAFNESQRMAIEQDPTWTNKDANAGMHGLATARSIALLSYRHYNTYQKTQSETTNGKVNHFKASSYQRYQGDKLVRRFNAYSYWLLSKAMDSHNVARGRAGMDEVLANVKAQSLFLGVSTDILFPVSEQQFLSDRVANAQLAIIDSDYGHDGFLIEIPSLTREIRRFYEKARPKPAFTDY